MEKIDREIKELEECVATLSELKRGMALVEVALNTIGKGLAEMESGISEVLRSIREKEGKEID